MAESNLTENAGRVLLIFTGDYSPERVYNAMDVAYFKNSSYVAKKVTVGNEPQEQSEYWQILAKGIADGNISDSTSEFEEAKARENIESGEQSKILFGKIKKWFSDLKAVAFSGSFNDLSDKPTADTLGAVKKDGDIMTGGLTTTSLRTNEIQSADMLHSVLLKSNSGKSAMIEKYSGNLVSVSGILAESDILTTEEQIDANTSEKMVAGATAIKSLKINLANSIGQINSNLTPKLFTTPNILLNSLEWVESTSGKYYASLGLAIPDNKMILSFYIHNWGLLKNSDIIQPYLNINGLISIMSNVGTFDSKTSISLSIVYI